ncbi:MAG: FAD-dependent oxidoreductase [Pseudomonadota bacterium]
MPDCDVDFLLAGQGLAGSLLAWELVRRGSSVAIIDSHRHPSASRVAAGLVNAVSGKRLTLQPNIRVLLDSARRRYEGLGQQFSEPLFHSLPLFRLFRDLQEFDYYRRRRENPAYGPFFERDAEPAELARLDAPFGGVWIKEAGYLDIGRLLHRLGHWLAPRAHLREGFVDSRRVRLELGYVRYDNLRARTLVFCEGSAITENHWFGFLPMQPVKGEILSLSLGAAPPLPQAIIHKGFWLAPRSDGTHRFGATYSWHSPDSIPTETARNQLVDALATLMPGLEFEVLAQVAGVRPATRDRNPLLGRHPEHPELAVFNGFGARGSLLIPWYAQAMADHLCDGAPVPPEAQIARYA